MFPRDGYAVLEAFLAAGELRALPRRDLPLNRVPPADFAIGTGTGSGQRNPGPASQCPPRGRTAGERGW